MTEFLRDRIERLFINNYEKDEIIDAVNEIAKEREDKRKEMELRAVRDALAEAITVYVNYFNPETVTKEEVLEGIIAEEPGFKPEKKKEVKVVKLSGDAVTEWLKNNNF